jgi:hypothetical protein
MRDVTVALKKIKEDYTKSQLAANTQIAALWLQIITLLVIVVWWIFVNLRSNIFISVQLYMCDSMYMEWMSKKNKEDEIESNEHRRSKIKWLPNYPCICVVKAFIAGIYYVCIHMPRRTYCHVVDYAGWARHGLVEPSGSSALLSSTTYSYYRDLKQRQRKWFDQEIEPIQHSRSCSGASW